MPHVHLWVVRNQLLLSISDMDPEWAGVGCFCRNLVFTSGLSVKGQVICQPGPALEMLEKS